ncbi:hypothetical protein STCU_11318 [Strigomonas culicis]|uniref:Uncharacterized protein n=1 Tax=Strigomonas culicis TaxID=28005 RepID=S9TJ35_9TRYP|nr:hypothetical protein STCU_11318 [Strigomonas culicis]|eukprot:EPY16398.1 hypothetical protein STCU_11318 [Strigomonas culicis]
MAEPFSGSELLLRKAALYARLQGYAQTDVHRDEAECNTLSYSGDTYPLLGLQRLCHALALADVRSARQEGGGGPAEPQRRGIDDQLWRDLLFSSFSGIQRATAQPSVRAWDSRATGAAAAPAGAAQREAERRAELYAAETRFLTAAGQLPTEVALLDPSIGDVAEHLRRLHRKLHRMRHPPRAAEPEAGEAPPSPRQPSPSSSSISLSSSEEEDADEEGAEAAPGAASAPLQDFYRRYDHVIAFANAERATRQVLEAIRQAPPPSAPTVGSGGPGAARLRPRLTPAQTVLQLAQQQQTAPPVGTDGAGGRRAAPAPSADDRRAVLAYLKRVAWLQKQAESGSASVLAEKTPEQRAQAELAHTQSERANFSRKRGRQEEGADGGEDEEK